MKKFFLTLVLALAGVVLASAADFGTSLGANFVYASKHSQKGIGINYKINFTENLRVSPEFQYFFSNDRYKAWDANANLEYTFPVFENCNVYPLAGLSYSHWTERVNLDGADKSVNVDDRIGGNLGAGIEYNVSSTIVINAEVRAQIIEDFSQCVICIGARYVF